MRMLLGGVIALCSSCAWVFQDHLQSEYTGRSEPRCSSSNGLPALDGVFAALNVALIIDAAADDSVTNKGSYIVGGIVWGLIHVASAGTGVGWSSECRQARAAYEEKSRQQAAAEAAAEAERAHEYDAANAQLQRPPAQPRGFFCSSNATSGFCARAKADCERARDAALASVAELSACTLVEKAWCFGDRCAPTGDTCIAQRERAAAAGGTYPECVETD